MVRINLAKDPSLRSGTTAAFAPIQGATLSITEDYAFYGKNALVVAKSGSNGSGVRIASPVPVDAGKPYAFSMYSRIPVEIPQAASAEIILQVEWLNSLSVVLRTDSSTTLLVEDDSTWYRLGGVWTAPAGATFANVNILQPLAGMPGAKLILDALLIEQASYIGGYFDNIPQDQKNTIVNKALSHVPQVINGIKLGADVVLNDLVLNTIDEDDTVWVVTDIDGWWGQTNPELPDIPRGTEDGSYDVEGRLTARTITVSGFFIPKNSEDALSKATNRLVEALNLVRKGGWLHAHEAPTKAAWVRLAGKPTIDTVNARGRTTFQVTLRAGDPIKYHWNDSDPEGYTTGEYRSADIPDYNITNYLTNPSAEATSGTTDVLTNLVVNPGFEAAGSPVVVRSNYITNPDFETAGTTVVVRANRFTNPRNVGTPTSGRAPGWSAYSVGSPTGSYAVSGNIQQITVTAMAAGVGTERFGLAENAFSLGSLTPSGSVISFSMDTSVVALPAGVRARVYVDVQDSTNGNATRGHWDAYFDATTGRLSGTATTNGTADTVRLYVWIENNNASTAFSGTATVGVTRILTEVGPVAPYFDGTNPPILRRNMIANAVPPVGTGTPTRWTTNRPANGTVEVQAGGEVVYTITTGGTGLTEGLVAQMIPGDSLAAPGYTYAGRIEVKAEGSLVGRALGSSILHDGTSLATSGNFTYTGNWQTINVLGTTVKGSSNLIGLYVYIPGALAGDILRVRNPMIDYAPLSTPLTGNFFTGSTVKPGYTYSWAASAGDSTSIEVDADFSTRWQGTTDSSVSELTGVQPAGAFSFNRVFGIQSTRWAKRGTKSLRLIPSPGSSGSQDDSYAQFTIPAAVYPGGTAIATRYQEGVLTNLRTDGRALSLVAFTPETRATGMVNAAGEQEVRLAIPALTSTYFLRFYHGGIQGSGDVWWDLSVLTEGNYTGTYFDGSTQPVLRTNLATKPQPEAALGWTSNNGTLYTRSFDATGGRRAGMGAAKFVRTATTPSAIIASAFSAGTSSWSTSGRIPCTPGQQIVASAHSKADRPYTTDITLSFYDSANVQVGTATLGATVSGAANEWTRPYVVATAPAGAVSCGIGNQRIGLPSGNTVGGETAWMTDAQFEVGSAPTEFFDGASVKPGFGYAFTGTTNASPSYEWDSDLSTRWQGTINASVSEITGIGLPSISTANGAAIRSARWSKQGTYSARIIANHPTNRSYAEYIGNPAPVGTNTAIATVYTEQAIPAGPIRSLSLGMGYNTGNPNAVTPMRTAAGEAELRLTGTMVNPGRFILFSDTKQGDPDVWFDLVTLVQGNYNGPAFTGNSTSSDPDLYYAWTGAADASTSVLRGTGVTNWTGSPTRAVVTSSSQWSNSRSKSITVTPVGRGDTSSYAEQTVTGLVVGNTYTIYGVVRVPATLTGTLSAYALRFFLSGTGSPSVTYSSTATNAPGVYVVRGTFVAQDTSYGIRFMNGSINISEPVQWDSMGVFDGDYQLPYFDGSTQNDSRHIYTWSGTPDLSTSKFVGWDEDVVTNIGTAEVSGIFTITGPVGAGTKIYNASTDETMTLQEPLRGAGMVADAYEVSSKDQVATIKTTAPHNLRVGDEVSLLGMVIPFSESNDTRIVTAVSEVFPYSFSFDMPTDDIDAMNTTGQVYLVNNDVLVVDTYTRSVTYNGEISGHRYRLTTLTDWIHFAPGENVIEYLDDVTEVEVVSKQISSNIVTLTTADTHYFIPGEEIEVKLPVDKPLAKKSLTSNVVTLTTAEPHGYSVGDVIDVASTETSTVVTKSRTSNVATLTTSAPHGISASDTIQVTLPSTAIPMQKQITANVATLTMQQAHGFSSGDSVTVALPTAATITNKQLVSGQVILTTAASHNFSVGDSITVSLPAAASVVGKARSGAQIIITTSAAHGFAVNDQVIVTLPTSATPTGNFSGSGTTNLVTVTTTAAHGFSVGDRISISGSTRPAYNGEKIVETIPSGTTFTFRDWTLTADLNTAVGSATITNLTNQSYNGTKTVISASGTTFAYNL